MKKNLYIIILFLLTLNLGGFAQCTPDPIYTTAGIPGVWPDTITGVASGTVGSAYSQNFTIIVPADTSVTLPAPVGTVTATINSATITGISGLPTGLSYACDISTCIWPGNTNGCFVISGTPAQAGNFTFTISVVINVDAPFIGATDLPSLDLNYSLTIADTGCPLPTAGFTFFAIGLNITCTDASIVSGNGTYSWDFDDGNTSTLQSPSHTYAGAGTYSVCLIVTDSCGSATNCQNATATDPSTSIDVDESRKRDFNILSVSPNPSSLNTEVNFFLNIAQPISYSLHNLIGEEIIHREINATSGLNSIRFSASALKPGLYFFSLTSKSGTLTEKLIVNNRGF